MIKIITTTSECESYLLDKTNIGLVPTMGNLHEGHLSLLHESLKNHETNIITIFVNPTQFAEGEDFDQYPRTLDDDIKKIESLSFNKKEIIVFAPKDPSEIYPSKPIILKASGPTQTMEGALRPDHFDGVVTVVKRLFDITHPASAYFGKKDYQQLKVIESLVREHNLPIEIKGLAIKREASGLALSSRNGYLSTEEKKLALKLYKSLNHIKEAILARTSYSDVQNQIKELLSQGRFNYLEVCHQKDLSPATEFIGDLVVLGNMKIGQIKILDNLEVSIK